MIGLLALSFGGFGWGFLTEGLGAVGKLLFVALVILVCVVTFSIVRRPAWGYYLLLTILWLLWLGYTWAAATNRAGLDSSQSGTTLWWAITHMLLVPYLYRRRWWFGIDVPASVPERSPQGGLFVLFVLSVLCTVVAAAVVVTARGE